MFALLIIALAVIALGVYTFIRVLMRRRKTRKIPWKIILFYVSAIMTLVSLCMYCLTAFETLSFGHQCWLGLQITPSWMFSLTSIIYLWIQIRFYKI